MESMIPADIAPAMVNINQYEVPTSINSIHISHNEERAGQLAIPYLWEHCKDIGSGAQAWVELHKSKATGRLRAVKIQVARHFGQDREKDRNLKRELQNLISVIHYPTLFTNFMCWYKCGELVYIAMEYAEHGNLHQCIKVNRNYQSERFAKEITRQVLQGLAVLHSKGICHRDLKPENILVHSEVPFHIKLADFGISKCATGTNLHTWTGTHHYLAPETHNLPKYTHAVDIWSLGCVLYEVLTGKKPFIDTSSGRSEFSYERLQKHIMGEGPLLLELKGTQSFSESCKDFLLNLLSPEPESRMSAIDALTHGWIFNFAGIIPQEGLDEAVSGRGPLDDSHRERLQFEYDQREYNSLEEYILGDLGKMYHVISYVYKEAILHLLQATSGRSGSAAGPMEVLRNLLPPRSPELALERAAAVGYFPIFTLLLQNSIGLGDGSWERYEAPLQAAAAGGHLEILKVLLAQQNYNTTIPHSSGGVLQAASGAGKIEIVKFLLWNGVAVDGGCLGPYRTALQSAAATGRLEVVELLLEQGANPNAAPNFNGVKALQAAATGGHYQVVLLLLEYQAEIDGRSWGPYGTALEAAVAGNHLKIVELLLTRGSNPGIGQGFNYGVTLKAAARGGHFRIVQLLLQYGAHVDGSSSGYHRTALQAAAACGHLKIVRLLLSKNADINAAPNFNGVRALQAAVSSGNLNIVEILLKGGARVDDESWGPHETALQAAAANGHSGIVKLLLKTAMVNAGPNFRGRRALQEAAASGYYDIVDILLQHGATSMIDDRPQHYGYTALQEAAAGGFLPVVQLLLQHGACIHDIAAPSRGRTALQAAAEGGHHRVVKLLIDWGADVNAPCAMHYGRTALQAAAAGGHIEVVQLLLNQKAEVNARCSAHYGHTALQAAVGSGNISLIGLLLRKGALVNEKAAIIGGETALEAAARGGDLEVLKVLMEASAKVQDVALVAAIENDNLDVTRYLLRRGVNINFYTGKILFLAAKSGSIRMVTLALASGARITDEPTARQCKLLLEHLQRSFDSQELVKRLRVALDLFISDRDTDMLDS